MNQGLSVDTIDLGEVLLIKKRKSWAYVLIDWLGKMIYHLYAIKKVEAKKQKRRHMKGNIVGTVK